MRHLKHKLELHLAVICIVGTVFIAFVVAGHAVGSAGSGYSYPYPSDPFIYLPVVQNHASIPTATPSPTPTPTPSPTPTPAPTISPYP